MSARTLGASDVLDAGLELSGVGVVEGVYNLLFTVFSVVLDLGLKESAVELLAVALDFLAVNKAANGLGAVLGAGFLEVPDVLGVSVAGAGFLEVADVLGVCVAGAGFLVLAGLSASRAFIAEAVKFFFAGGPSFPKKEAFLLNFLPTFTTAASIITLESARSDKLPSESLSCLSAKVRSAVAAQCGSAPPLVFLSFFSFFLTESVNRGECFGSLGSFGGGGPFGGGGSSAFEDIVFQ